MSRTPQWDPELAGWHLSEALRRLNLTHGQARRAVIFLLTAAQTSLPEHDFHSRNWVNATASHALEIIFRDELNAAVAAVRDHTPSAEATITDHFATGPLPLGEYISPRDIPEVKWEIRKVMPCDKHTSGEPVHDMYLTSSKSGTPSWHCGRTVIPVDPPADE